jgi:hypothetical protein
LNRIITRIITSEKVEGNTCNQIVQKLAEKQNKVLYGFGSKMSQKKKKKSQPKAACERHKPIHKDKDYPKEPQIEAASICPIYRGRKPTRQTKKAFQRTSHSRARNQHPAPTHNSCHRNGFPTSPHEPTLKVSTQSDTFCIRNKYPSNKFFNLAKKMLKAVFFATIYFFLLV